MSTKQVTIAGTSGSIAVDVADGSTVREVLLEAAATLGLELGNGGVERLSPVVDSKPARLDDVVAPEAMRVTAAPAVRNG
jgi:hypothetical protein